MILTWPVEFTNYGQLTAYSLQVKFPDFPQKVVMVQQRDPWSQKVGSILDSAVYWLENGTSQGCCKG